MTLVRTPDYDLDRVTPSGDHAVVVGASMAGLVAARVLRDAVEKVTVFERDSIPQSPGVRRGVPQGRHVHALQEAGQRTLDQLFPGFSDGVRAAGGVEIDLASDFNFYDEGGFVTDGPNRLPMSCASRPLFEHVVREKLIAREGVQIRDGCQVTGYRSDPADEAVVGVTVRDDGTGLEEVDADLVVDATGRASRTPRWLGKHGFPAPETDEVTVDLAYSTIYLDRPPNDRRTYHVMPCPPRQRGCVVLPVEGDRWVVTLFGLHGDHPPATIPAFETFADSLPVEAIGTLVDEREVLSTDVDQYPVPSSLRRRYSDLTRFPDGLMVMGDAIASFNPIYGQGLSVAALEALCFHRALADTAPDRVATDFFRRIEPVIEDAWRIAVGADFRFTKTTGPKPLGTDLLNRYLSRLTRTAHDDVPLTEAYARVVMMERRPTSLFHPRLVWRVLKPT